MIFLARVMERLHTQASGRKRQPRPLLRATARFLRSAFSFLWGLVEANWDHPATLRAGDRLDQWVTVEGARDASNKLASRTLTTRLQSLRHGDLRNGPYLASFPNEVKRGAPRYGQEWRIAATNIVELTPDDELFAPPVRRRIFAFRS